MKTALIRQPAGLGDILWVQPIVNHIASRGFNVLYPVCDHYYDLVINHIETDNSNFVRESDLDPELKKIYSQENEIIESDFEYYPFDCISGREELSSYTVMEKKYYFYKKFIDEFDINDNNWRESVRIKRDYQKEKELENYFQIDTSDYIWINNFFGTPPGVVTRDIKTRDDMRKIYNTPEVKNIFHFCGILENAKEIHTVETSFCYLIELLDCSGQLNMYSRKFSNGIVQHNDFSYIDKIYKKDWIKHL